MGEDFPVVVEVEAAVGAGKMKLSIIIITLNEENYIHKLLDCLKGQTFKDFEVIVIDGNSDDKTVEVAERYKNYMELNVIISDKRGAGYQRNLGVKNTNCENLLFMDADIIFKENHLEKIINAVKRRKLDCATTFYKPIEDDKFYKLAFLIYNNYIFSIQKVFGLSAGAFLYVKKSAFNDVGGFDEGIVYSEDRDFVIRLFKKKYKFAVLKNPSTGVSIRRYEKEGKSKIITTVLFGEIKQLLGKKFRDSEKINYKFGHYDGDN